MKPLCSKCATNHWGDQPCETEEQRCVRLGLDAVVVLPELDLPPEEVVVETVTESDMAEDVQVDEAEVIDEVSAKPKRTLSPEHLAKLQAGRNKNK